MAEDGKARAAVASRTLANRETRTMSIKGAFELVAFSYIAVTGL